MQGSENGRVVTIELNEWKMPRRNKRDVDRYVSQIPEREVTLQKCTDNKTLHKSYVISCYNWNKWRVADLTTCYVYSYSGKRDAFIERRRNNQLKEGKLSNKPITNTAWIRAQLCKLQQTRLAAASDKVYQLLAKIGGSLRVLRLPPPLKLVAII